MITNHYYVPPNKGWASFKSLYTSDSLMHIFTKGEDPDEMQDNAAFHQGLHCLLRQSVFRERNSISFGNYM